MQEDKPIDRLQTQLSPSLLNYRGITADCRGITGVPITAQLSTVDSTVVCPAFIHVRQKAY